jgi:inorganic pyrophosphatase
MDIASARFWDHADRLVAGSQIVIDRPAGSTHPRFAGMVYPFDYGYLDGTTGGDGDGVDVWRGSLSAPTVTAVIVTIDVHKRDAEVKLLIGCTNEEMQRALATHRTNWQAALLVPRSTEGTNE